MQFFFSHSKENMKSSNIVEKKIRIITKLNFQEFYECFNSFRHGFFIKIFFMKGVSKFLGEWSLPIEHFKSFDRKFSIGFRF